MYLEGDILKKKKNLIVIIAVIIGVLVYISPFVLIIAGVYIDSRKTSFEINNDIISIDKGNITIDNVTSYYNAEDSSFYIVGYAHNNSNKSFSGVTLTYRIYDQNGVILGDSTAYLDNFEKGKVWKFKIIYSDIDSKEVGNIEFINVDTY